MKRVVDSSVAFKWEVTEADSDQALRLRDDYRNAVIELEEAARTMKLDPNIAERLKVPKRALVVSVPVTPTTPSSCGGSSPGNRLRAPISDTAPAMMAPSSGSRTIASYILAPIPSQTLCAPS